MKILLFANTEWYLYNFRLALAQEIRRRGGQVVMVSPPGPYGERLERERFRWIPLAMQRRGLNPLREWRVVRALSHIYRRERPDLVHHFTLKPVAYGSLAARFARVPAVVNAVAGMGYVFTSKAPLARALRPVVRNLLKLVINGRSNRVIVQNPEDGALLCRSRLTASENVRLIRGSGVDTDRFQPSQPFANDMPRVLLATRLLWDKGVGEFVEAARILKRANVAVEWWLAGAPDAGNPSSVPQRQIDSWCEEGLVRALAHVEDMPKLLSQVDIVTLPSYREGVPRILIEAAASGLPIVATDVPGCREIVTDGVNGLLVPPRDPTALAAAIRRLVESPDLCRRMGTSGRHKVLAEFDERSVIDATLKVYAELLAFPAQS